MRKLIIPILFLSVSCAGQTGKAGQTGPIDNFYFPIQNFFNETSYCFVNQNDTTEKSYWKMKTTVLNKDTLLQTSIFDSNDRITETMTEKVINGNSKIDSYILYDYDQQVNKLYAVCKVVDSLVFKTNQTEGEQIQWKVNFKDYTTSNICELSKIRKLKNQNNNQKTFTDSMKFVVADTKQGYEYSMTSVYQKNKGLISYKLVLPDGKVKDFVLTNVK